MDLKDEIKDVNTENDETALDAELEESLQSVKAGKTLEVKPPEQTEETESTEPAGEEAPTGETATTDEAPSNPQATEAAGEDEFRIPNKGKFESDESYEKRVELFDLVKRRKAANTSAAKEALSEKIAETKGDLKTLGATERFTQTKVEEGPISPTEEVDPQLAADQARLKELGGATKEDIAEIIRQERETSEVQNDLKKFVEKHSDLKDEDVREVFFDFVEKNYIWQGKSGKELTATLEMARENMFRPSESIQDRVLKGAGVAEKVNAMQFPGGNTNRAAFTPEIQQSIDEIKATGMSEEKAIELLSDD